MKYEKRSDIATGDNDLQSKTSAPVAYADAHGEPLVTIIMPVRNEETHIADSLGGILQQDYPAIEILIADGMSADRTREIIEGLRREHGNIRIIDNPDLIVPTGLNRAIEEAQGEIIVRVDGHCQYPRDYVRSVVDLLRTTGAANAGGVLEPYGTKYQSRSIAAAYAAPFGVGGALRGHGEKKTVRDVDAVHAGCWFRSELREVGGFDPELVRNQDDELSFRLRERGKRVVQSTTIRVRYAVRDSFMKLFLQFLQYGHWKVRVIQKHPAQASLRHYFPAALCLVTAALAFLLPFFDGARVGLGVLLFCYLCAITTAALVALKGRTVSLLPGAVLAIMLMHFGYGIGFLLGVLRWTLNIPAGRLFRTLTR
jgi:cellulose synthase/poly-beta-1,6-N-acetylglucosamine synthase-like glycosyltransferase